MANPLIVAVRPGALATPTTQDFVLLATAQPDHTLGSTRSRCTLRAHCCPQKNWVEGIAQGNETTAGEAVLVSRVKGANEVPSFVACLLRSYRHGGAAQ